MGLNLVDIFEFNATRMYLRVSTQQRGVLGWPETPGRCATFCYALRSVGLLAEQLDERSASCVIQSTEGQLAK